MVTQTEAISRFLNHFTHPDLAGLYNPGMEVQVNVAQDGGDRIEGEYQGKRWVGWTNNVETWKPIRIPYKANTEPEYVDKQMAFDIVAHAEGIGMTGWNFEHRQSIWVAYDFDAITGHSDKHEKKLTEGELQEIVKTVSNIPWVTVRKSTGGNGLHLYVFLKPVSTKNHNEHSALARSILGMMSGITGYDFSSKVDVCGGNMWVWHRKMRGTPGLSLIKQGTLLEEIPENWRDHVKVVSGQSKKAVPDFVSDIDEFEELYGRNARIPLDDTHKALIKYLQDNNRAWSWSQDHHMLICHTKDLKDAHKDLGLKGVFDTLAQGTDQGDHNCFCYPLRKGAWAVRRYTQGVAEAPTWEQDGKGWTKCTLNIPPDLRTAARRYGGVEHKAGGFIFREAEMAMQAALLIGVDLSIPPAMRGRKTKLKEHRDGRLIVELVRDDTDTNLEDWLGERKTWTRVFSAKIQAAVSDDITNYDDFVRHLITANGENYGWVAKSDNEWRKEPLEHIRPYLQAMGVDPKDTVQVVGASIAKPWKIINAPFQPEYLGDRIWNRNAAKIRYPRKEEIDGLHYPTWMKILNHVGEGLDEAISNNAWAKANGIKTGADYLKCWIASLFQEPTEPLPYIFLYGPQNSGKSIFHEALHLLISNGVQRAEIAITSQQSFNAELENAVLCFLEEINLSTNKTAYNKIKDWVTSRTILVHPKGKTPYSIVNTTHWIHTANEISHCPIFPGDTRITMIFVDSLAHENLIPKKQLIPLLEKEASDFITSILTLELPPSNDRLNVPVILTEDKTVAEQANKSSLEDFIEDRLHNVDGEWILFSEFFAEFSEYVKKTEGIQSSWTKNRVTRELPRTIMKGRCPATNQVYVANVSFNALQQTKAKFRLVDGKLVRQ